MDICVKDTLIKCIDNIINLVKENCKKYMDEIEYRTPDNKYHFWICVNCNPFAKENGDNNDLFYMIELNKVADGKYEPFDPIEFADFENYDDLKSQIIYMLHKYTYYII